MIRIETGRLLLRTPGAGDLAACLTYRNDPGSMETRRMAARDWAVMPEDASGWRMPGIEEKERPGGNIVGEVGAFLHADGNGEGDVGWWLRPGLRGRGIATEAGRGLPGWCFAVRGLRRVTASCFGGERAIAGDDAAAGASGGGAVTGEQAGGRGMADARSAARCCGGANVLAAAVDRGLGWGA